MRKVIVILLVILAAWNVVLTMNMMQMNSRETPETTTVIKELSTEFETDYTGLVSLCTDKTVGIVSRGTYSENSGSGVIYGKGENGTILIVTCNHIIASDDVSVFFANRSEFPAEVIGRDAVSDIALLAVTPNFSVDPFNLGDSSVLKEGEYVMTVACRSTLDYFPYYSQGMITSLNRVVRRAGSESGINDYDMRMIQTSAEIDNAALGGALVNMNGDLVGILSTTPSTMESYALNINEVKHICAELLEKGEVDRTLLGFFAKDIEDLPLYLKSYYEMDLSIEKGILVTEVSEGSLAAAAGIAVGDVITRINDVTVDSYGRYREWVYANESNVIELEVHHGMNVRNAVIELPLETEIPEVND